jgi:PilZ domain
MRLPTLDEEYQSIVREALARGELDVRKNGDDLRSEPRFRKVRGGIAVRVEPEFRMADVSARGIAFFSELPFELGSTLHVVLHGTIAFHARVVGIQLVETDSFFLEARYRVQCRFHDDADGKQLLVLMKEMERLGSAAPVN